MSTRVVLHPDALRELGDAIEWYDQGGQGRGVRFRVAFDRIIDRCLEWPGSAAEVSDPGSHGTFRHAKVPHSHYRIVYRVSNDRLEVVAVAHERRTPRYWENRG